MADVQAARTAALLVPREALVGATTPGAQATVVTLGDGRAERKTVQLGLLDERPAEVVSGLAEGELVALADPGGFQDGEAVAPRMATARNSSTTSTGL